MATKQNARSSLVAAMAVAASFGCGSSSQHVETHPVSAAQQRIFTRLRVQTAQARVRMAGGEISVAMDTNGDLVGATHSYINAITEAERLHAYSRTFLGNNSLYGLAGYAKSLRGICDRCVQQLLRARMHLLGSR